MSGVPTSERLPRKVVALGGGHGLARALEALVLLGIEPVAVVTVADDGGSSGRLRRDLGIIPPGDLRMALLTLARNERLARVLEHRFSRGDLDGHALGNLFLVALAEQSDGDFVAALDAAGTILSAAGRVLPATPQAVQLKACVAGQEVEGQVRVATAEGTIERVWLEPTAPPPCPPAVQALREADAVVLGPGSLFTSVIATLLVPSVHQALADSDARRIAVCNLSTQPGETSGLDVEAHLERLRDHLPRRRLDVAVVHDGPPVQGSGSPLQPPNRLLEAAGDTPLLVHADLAVREDDGTPRPGHDPERLARALAEALSLSS